MYKVKTFFGISVFLVSILLSNQALAKSRFVAAQPLAYNNAIGCGSCHSASPYTENNVGMPYGITFNLYVDDDNVTANSYILLERYDSDGDGFSNGQEIYGFSNFNYPSVTPHLTGTGVVTLGVVTALPATNETVALSAATAVTPTTVIGEKNIGGTVGVSMTNLMSGATNNAGTATFMFSTGGLQTGAKAFAYDANGVATSLPVTVNTNGSGTVVITDESVYDTYSQAQYIADAKAVVPAFTPTAIFDGYASVSPYAQISPLAVVDSTAIIDDYAIVDNYAVINAGSHISSYAYVAANAVINAGITVDPYVNVTGTVATNATMPATFVGTVQTRLAFVTTVPLVPAGQGGGDGEGDDEAAGGGLHCMTSGFGTQGLMFLGLLATGFMVRRKKR